MRKGSPDYWLDEMRELAAEIKELERKHRYKELPKTFKTKALRLAILVRAMDNWLSKYGDGLGSLPEAWRPRVVGPARSKRRRAS